VITEIHIDGYRSLKEFQMTLMPGVNLLVGPNGSGKTNIISFLSFLSRLVTHGVRPAFAHIGGAGRAFTRTKNKFGSQISCTVKGKLKGLTHRSAETVHDIDYEYSFIVKLSEEKRSLYFERQSLKARIFNHSKDAPLLFEEGAKEFEVHFRTDEHLFEVAIELKSFAKGMESYYRPLEIKEGELAIEYAQGQLGKYAPPPDSPMFWVIAEVFWPTNYLRSDLSEIVMLNIDPRAVRTAEDSAEEPGINDDGSGLAATLYFYDRLKERNFEERDDNFYYPNSIRYSNKILPKIQDYVRLVNPQIESVMVHNDILENLLKVIYRVRAGESEIPVPISSASDGTVKWTALITAILSLRGTFSIEEPENYIHPTIQREFINILRNELARNKMESFALVSTHSETILNAANPEEIVVVSIEDGRTKVKRPQHISILKEEIKESGFGLGFYYLNGALEDV